jgi:hypothetical protein
MLLVFAPAEQDLVLVQFVIRPLEELFLLLEKISSLWALKIKPLKILIMVKLSPIAIRALPQLQELQHWLDVINSNWTRAHPFVGKYLIPVAA